MGIYRWYKGCVIKQQPKSHYAKWQVWKVWDGQLFVIAFNTRQQARDYVNSLIPDKESHGNTPAGIQDTIVTKK